MSSITLCMTSKDDFIIAVDTAKSWVTDDGTIYRDAFKKVDKLIQIGKDLIFISGMGNVTSRIKTELRNNTKKYLNYKDNINIEALTNYLSSTINSSDSEYVQADITIASIVDNKGIVYQLKQINDFEAIISPKEPLKKDEAFLLCEGFQADAYYKKALVFFSQHKLTEPNSYIKFYAQNYSEGVGNSVKVFNLDKDGVKLLLEKKLEEKGLRYCIKDENGDVRRAYIKDGYLDTDRLIAHNIYGTMVTEDKTTGNKIKLSDGTINFSQNGTNYATINFSEEKDAYIEVNKAKTFTISNGSKDYYVCAVNGRSVKDNRGRTQENCKHLFECGSNGKIYTNGEIFVDNGKTVYLNGGKLDTNTFQCHDNAHIGSDTNYVDINNNGCIGLGVPKSSFEADDANSLRLNGYIACGGSITAASITPSSTEKIKTNIEEYTSSALDIVNKSTIYKYNLKEDLKRGIDIKKYGFIVERETPKEVISETNDSIDLYSALSILWKAVQEQSAEIERLKEQLK